MSRLPSYDLKVDRAEKHLIDLELEIRRYVRLHPYQVGVRMENERKIYRLEFTRQPDPELALIAGDFLYNIRAALDHLAKSLVPSNNRGSVYFPVLWQGVWEESTEGDDKQRRKDRAKWKTYTERMPDEAVAILKREQPPDLGSNADNTSGLAVLNRLRNTDAHSKLTIVASTLVHPVVRITDQSGEVGFMRGLSMGDRDGLPDKAVIAGVPDDAVDVEIQGIPKVTIRVGEIQGGFAVAEAFRALLLNGTRSLIEELRPYDRRN